MEIKILASANSFDYAEFIMTFLLRNLSRVIVLQREEWQKNKNGYTLRMHEMESSEQH